MDAKARRNLGAHYTSEENILELIQPLFLDKLWAEFRKVKVNSNRLFDFHKKLRALNLLDPACGCGNYLVISYRELRLLELEASRSVCCGAGCWPKAPRFTSRTAPSNGAMKHVAWRRCTA